MTVMFKVASFLFCSALTVLVLWGVFGFIEWEWNVALWHWVSRTVMSAFLFAAVSFYISFLSD